MSLQVLIDWINSELEEDRIIVKDLEEDCYDGQVLQKLFGTKQPFGALTYHPTYSSTSPWAFQQSLLQSLLLFLGPLRSWCSQQKSCQAENWTWPRWRSRRSAKSRSCRQFWRPWMSCCAPTAGLSSGVWTVSVKSTLNTGAHPWIFQCISTLSMATWWRFLITRSDLPPQLSIQRTWWPSFICWLLWRCTSRPLLGFLSTCPCRWWLSRQGNFYRSITRSRMIFSNNIALFLYCLSLRSKFQSHWRSVMRLSVFFWAETRGHPADGHCDERADQHHRVRATSQCQDFPVLLERLQTLTCLFLSSLEQWWEDSVSQSQSKTKAFKASVYSVSQLLRSGFRHIFVNVTVA